MSKNLAIGYFGQLLGNAPGGAKTDENDPFVAAHHSGSKGGG